MQMASRLLLTKLYRPAVPVKYVQRPFLVQRLQEGLETGRQLTLVSAPAGFGKTTCVSEWVDTLALPVTWLSLDPADDDPGRFFTYLVAALQQVDETLGQEVEAVLRAGQLPPIEGIRTTLSNDILELNQRFLLILDDFQVIENRFILQVWEKLVSNMPQPLYLVLITREDPSLPLARLRANNQLTEIRAVDLRFSSQEADHFLSEVMGLSLSVADMVLLEERTEGWIAGLQLAGLSMRDRANPSHFIANLSGSHRYILSYLTEEVLNQQPAEIQHFLLQTAVLGKLNGDLCNFVTERDDGRFLLEQLYNNNLFLTSLDDEQQWYRYHHLFADLLRHQLQQTFPADTIRSLHSRATTWLAQHGLDDDAIKHALAADDYETAAALSEQAARPLIFSGQINTVKSWLAALPSPTFAARPRLAVYRAWIELVQGKSALSAHGMQELDGMLNDLPPSPENDQLRLELMVILCRFVALSGNTARAIQMAEEVLASLPAADQASRARANSALAIAYGMEGQVEKAEKAYAQCLRLAQAAGYYSLASHTTMVMAQGRTEYGQLRQAARAYQSIIDMGEQSGQKLFFPAGQGYVGLADIHLEWLDLELAEAYVQQGIDLCRQGGLAGVVTGTLIKSRLRQAQGDLESALAELEGLAHADGAAMIAVALRQVQIRRALGENESLSRWVMPLTALLDGRLSPIPLPLLVAESVQAILIRIYIAQEEMEQAQKMLDTLQQTAASGGRHGRLVGVYLLQAMVLQKQDQETAALDYLQKSLALAEPEGYGLLFLEEGPAVALLLHTFLTRSSAPARLKHYAQKILDAFPEEARPAADLAPAATAEALVEPLSERELEILSLIGDGYSNQEIADQLVITVHTVKKHSSNIYGKLGVSSRTQAVARARELQLL